jgi:methanogenic corrinoid protein MtbC1
VALSQRLFDAILDGKAQLAQSIVEEEVKGGVEPMALISEMRWTPFVGPRAA